MHFGRAERARQSPEGRRVLQVTLARVDAMPNREFRDSSGRLWMVWDVRPERGERRVHSERRRRQRAKSDRRQRQRLPAVIGGDLARGWLAFETGGERRRYAPIPDEWVAANEIELRRWCEEAKPLPPKKRLIE